MGDDLYGGCEKLTLANLKAGSEDEVLVDRYALHAYTITISHPEDGERTTFTTPLHRDMARAVAALRKYAPGSGPVARHREILDDVTASIDPDELL